MAPGLIIALPGVGVVPTDTPVLRADDLGVLRGDGLFEMIHVRRGTPWLLDEHLDRLERSARLLGLTPPARAELVTLAGQACAAWPADVEGGLRLVCTRGPEGDPTPTCFATLGPVNAAQLRGRRDGISVRTAGYPLDTSAGPGPSWLLRGAKTLSYAVNMAALRWAAEQGADDVLWFSTDGFALEAPTASLVWLSGHTLCTVPPEQAAILPGTTAAWLLDHAGELGLTAERRMARRDDLLAADGIWLLSSIRGAAEVRALDSVPRPASALTGPIHKLLDFES